MKNINKFLNNFPFEALVWLGGLTYLALINIENGRHFTFCPFALAGIDFCPGCGLGRAINQIFNLNFTASFNIHPLGIPSLLILLYRSFFLIKDSIKSFSLIRRKNNDESFTFNAES